MLRYVTRWALSTGIRQLDGEFTDNAKFFIAKSPVIWLRTGETWVTLDDAQVEARRMADKRIATLKRAIAKLEDPNWKAKVNDSNATNR